MIPSLPTFPIPLGTLSHDVTLRQCDIVTVINVCCEFLAKSCKKSCGYGEAVRLALPLVGQVRHGEVGFRGTARVAWTGGSPVRAYLVAR